MNLTVKKWICISTGFGAGAVLMVALLLGGIAWYSSRPVPWNRNALSIVWSEAYETFDLDPKTRQLKHADFWLNFALQNNTARDITIPEDATIMKRLLKGGALADATAAKLHRSCFIPAYQRAEVSIQLAYACTEEDLKTGAVRDRDSRVCFNEALADSDGLVLFDHINRIQVALPKPGLR